MATTSSVNSSMVSLTGLFSKLDTDTLIQALMASDQSNYTTLENRKTDYGKIQSVFRDLNTKLSTLRTAANDLLLKMNLTKTTAASSDTKVLNATSTSGAAAGTYQIVVSNIAQSHIIRTTDTNASDTTLVDSLKTRYANGETIQITVDGVTVDVGQLAADSSTYQDFLNGLKSQINSGSANLSASLMKTSDTNLSLVLSTKSTGLGNSIKAGVSGAYGISGDDATLQALGLYSTDPDDPTKDPDDPTKFKNTVQAADDAHFTVNGVPITSGSNTVNGVIENVTLSLVAGGTTTVTVDTDYDAVTDLMSKFVDAYNAVIDAIDGAKSFQDSNSRTPLQADSTLDSLRNSLGSWMNLEAGKASDGTSSLDLKYMYQIGLEIDKGATTASEMTGKITFDKDAFKKALQENPDGVYNLLAYNQDGYSKGIARVFSDNLYSWTSPSNGILKTKIDGYDSEISFISDQMDQLQERLNIKEASLKQKFTNMETALATLQSQQSWLNGVVNAMTSSKS